MPNIEIEVEKDIAILKLNNGITNAISLQMIHELLQEIDHLKKEYNGLVLSGGMKFFSIGFNLPELLKFNRLEMADFFYKFNQAAFNLFTIDIPTVCTMSGHAVAGGNILALTCDYRFACSEEKLIGLNEVKLGLPVPYLADLILYQIVSHKEARNMLYHGELMPMSKALQIDLIDAIYSEEEIHKQAIKKVLELSEFYGPAFAEIKANRVETVRLRYLENFKIKHEIMLDCWFKEPVQKMLKKASQKF